MKIVMFGHKRMPSREGGVEVVVQELSVRMAKLGHEVVCYNRRGHHVSGKQFDEVHRDQFQGVKIKRVPTLNIKGLAAVTSSFFASVWTAFSNADVVHIHGEGPAIFCRLPKLLGKRVIVTVHGLDWQREKWKSGIGAKFICLGEKMAVRYADEIIVLSRNVQTYFRKTYGRNTVWIPNGVTRPVFTEADLITSQFGLDGEDYILFLGRLVPEKGIHYLIHAFGNVSTDKKLVIAGGTSDSDAYCSALRELASGDDRVLFTGFVQGRLLEELYSNAYLYVLPSDTEGMPLSLLEAMSHGLACLVSDIPESMEVIEDYGASFPAGNIAKLQQALQILCDSPDTVRDYKKNARDYICGKYNWDDVTNRTLELYL